MILSESDYQEALRRANQDREVAARQQTVFASAGLTPEEVETAMEPTVSFQAQLLEDIAWYENVRRRNFAPISRLPQIGRQLIALRIANGWSQRELAQRLDVSKAVVSRDERNEYHGITMERAQRIFDALQATLILQVAGYSDALPKQEAKQRHSLEEEFAEVR